MRQQNHGPRRPVCKRPFNHAIVPSKLASDPEIVHPGEYETGDDFSRAISQHGISRGLQQGHAAVEAGIILVVSRHRPHSEPGVQGLEHRDQRLQVPYFAVDQVADDHHDVRFQSVHAFDQTLHPPFSDQRTKMQIRYRHQHQSVAFLRQAGKPHLMFGHDRGPKALHEADNGEQQGGDRGTAPDGRRKPGQQPAAERDQVRGQ